MAGDLDPVDEIDGLPDDGDVSKSETRAYLKSGIVGLFLTAARVRLLNLADRYRIMVGSRFFRKDTTDTTSVDDGTESTLCIIDGDNKRWLVIEGERYDLQYSGTGQIGASEGLNPGFAPTPLQLLAGLPDSFWYAIDVPPTSDHVTTFKKSLDQGITWTDVFTATILAGERVGTFSLAADTSLPTGAILRPFGPASADITLETVGGVIAARR